MKDKPADARTSKWRHVRIEVEATTAEIAVALGVDTGAETGAETGAKTEAEAQVRVKVNAKAVAAVAKAGARDEVKAATTGAKMTEAMNADS